MPTRPLTRVDGFLPVEDHGPVEGHGLIGDRSLPAPPLRRIVPADDSRSQAGVVSSGWAPARAQEGRR